MKVLVETSSGERACRELQKRFEQAMFLRVPVELAKPGSLPRFEMKAKRWVKRDDAERSTS
jgi:phenylacetate-coenzyme A ligase PaaK-like adenylate-forming protein